MKCTKEQINNITNGYDNMTPIHKPEESARDFLQVMDDAAKDCDMALFTMYMANVYSHVERAYNKGNMTASETISFKESAAYKVTEFLKNCECRKIIKTK